MSAGEVSAGEVSTGEVNADQEVQPRALVRFVRRRPWVMFVPGFLLTVPATYLALTLLYFVLLIVPAVIILFLIGGPPWYGLVQGWRRRSWPRLWFGGGYTLGASLAIAQIAGLGRLAPWLY